jgi:hypothetical protein
MSDPIENRTAAQVMNEAISELSKTQFDLVEGYAMALIRSLPADASIADYALCVQTVTRDGAIATRYWLEHKS